MPSHKPLFNLSLKLEKQFGMQDLSFPGKNSGAMPNHIFGSNPRSGSNSLDIMGRLLKFIIFLNLLHTPSYSI